MTDTSSAIVTALVAALICVVGGLITFVLTLWMLPAPSVPAAPGVDQMLREARFDDPAAVDRALPVHVVAVWVDPDVLTRAAPAPPSSTGPAPSTNPAASDIPDPPDDGQPTDQPTAPDHGLTAQPPSGSPVVRVVRIDDPTQLVSALDRLRSSSTVTTQIRDGVWLTVANPGTGDPATTAATLGAVTALTGAVAALAMLAFRPSRRPAGPWADDPRPAGGGPAPNPPPSTFRHAALPGTAPSSAGPPTVAVTPTRDHGPVVSPPPDPQVPVLLTQRTTLVRGLADLAAKLPAEFEWQAANVLDAAGVHRIVPDGATFDPAAHHVVGTEPSPEAKLDDTVARTLRPGWADRGQVMVPARVVLYALPEQPPRGPDDDSG